MTRQGRILIVDNLETWRVELVEILRRNGFHAESASTVTEALEHLNESIYHVLVADIRMKETDESNIDGIHLLSELERGGLSEAIKVIMLSAYGTTEQFRSAFRDYKVADFLSKDTFSQQAFLESVQQVFSRNANINLALDILWQSGSRSEQVVLDLEVSGTSIKHGTPLLNQIATELEDLLCRLFYQAKGILVRPLTPGQSSTGVVRIQPFYGNRGIGREMIVKFGDFSKIQEEYHNFKEYVELFIGGGRNTTVLDVRRTTHLGGITYAFLGTNNDQLVDFADFYRRSDISQITDALDRLFLEICGPWYANHEHLQLLDLTADYQRLFGYTPKQLEQIRSRELKAVQGKQKLRFTSLNGERTFTNPILIMAGSPLACPTYTCITHGDFNPHNLLVDNTGHMWLIDFQETGQSHILRDVALLDSAVRFQLLPTDQATLEERLHLEEALLDNIHLSNQVEQLASKLSTTNRALAKAYAITVHLRTLAYRLVGQNPNNVMYEYYIALFYTALNTLQFFSLSSRQREHALLCASLLADRLGLGGQDEVSRDISKIQLATSEKSFRNYQLLAEIIIRRMDASNPILIKSPYFEAGTVWEVSLPTIGLRLKTQKTTQKAILFLRQKEEEHAVYEHLTKIQSEKDAEFIIVVDIADIRTSPLRIDSGIVWFRPENLVEMVRISKEELPGWLGRFITTQVDVRSLLPYRTHGAATELFFGRDYELMRLIGGNLRGGIIIGANRSGKTSLLHRLGERLKQRGLTVVGPITFTGLEGFQSFFERTLIDPPLSIDCSAEMTPEVWSSVLRAYYKREGKSPVFLLDEVDDLIAVDATKGLILGRQMRSLQSDGQSEFYLAGHARLREAIALEGGPLRNFAEEIVLTGLTQTASMSLIQEPMKRLGFYISDDQARRIFKGTAGVAVLIQEFCIRLLYRHFYLYRHFHQDTKSDIEDAAIEAVEQLPDYLRVVFHHYEYGQEWVSMSAMLIAAILKEVTRQDITLEFSKYGVKLGRDRLDAALEFLVQFGVLEEFKAGHYRILSGYLSHAIMTRNPRSLLETKIRDRRKKRGS